MLCISLPCLHTHLCLWTGMSKVNGIIEKIISNLTVIKETTQSWTPMELIYSDGSNGVRSTGEQVL